MSSNIKVTISKPESATTVLVPNTGGFSLDNLNTLIPVGLNLVASILAFFCLIIFIRIRKKSHRVYYSDEGKMKLGRTYRKSIGMVLLMLTLFGMAGGFSNINSEEKVSATTDESTVANGTDASLAISTEDINLNIVRDGKTAYGAVANKVVVKAGTDFGYNLSVYASGSDIVSEENKDNKISALDATSTPSALKADSWGLSTSDPKDESSEVWRALPTTLENAITIKTITEATSENDTTTVYYGSLITDELPYGTYVGPTINYVAVANVDPTLSFSWDDGTIPGNSYSVSLNSISGEYTYTRNPGCSIANRDECPKPTTYKGTIPAEDISQLLDVASTLDFSTSNADLFKNYYWFSSFQYFSSPTSVYAIKGQPECDDDGESCIDSYNFAKEADVNNDGTITNLEYAKWVIYELIIHIDQYL